VRVLRSQARVVRGLPPHPACSTSVPPALLPLVLRATQQHDTPLSLAPVPQPLARGGASGAALRDGAAGSHPCRRRSPRICRLPKCFRGGLLDDFARWTVRICLVLRVRAVLVLLAASSSSLLRAATAQSTSEQPSSSLRCPLDAKGARRCHDLERHNRRVSGLLLVSPSLSFRAQLLSLDARPVTSGGEAS